VPSLTLVIPATKPTTLPRCLEAVRAAEDGPEELIVVERPWGIGPAAARNSGACRASGDVIVFLDADVMVRPDAFTRIRAAFYADPGLTAVFGSYDDCPADPGVVSGFRNLLHHSVHMAGAGEAATFWSGLGAVRRDAFLECGGYDAERFAEPSVEDIDLGTRLAAAGGRIVLEPGIQGTHLKRWTLGSMVRTDFNRRAVPWVSLLMRHRSTTNALNLAWRHRLSALASVGLAASVVARRPRPALAGLAALAALNRGFYSLLLRRRGPWQAAAGVGLHAIHHLSAVTAVPVGVVAQLGGRPGGRVASKEPRLAPLAGPERQAGTEQQVAPATVAAELEPAA
jgi:GT2 family glycosyltransferase